VGLDEGRRTALLEDEFARGAALAEAGALRAIWRVPGRLANKAIWTAADAAELHAALASLPLWPYMDVTVTPLAQHPLSEACAGFAPVDKGCRLPQAKRSASRRNRAI
jgi:muconolactone D-isomerase